MIKIKYILVFLIYFFIACKHDLRVVNDEPLERILVPKLKNRVVNFSELFSSWKLVPLETNRNSVISKISRIQIFDNKFFLLDRNTNCVVVFNIDGKFLFRIKKGERGLGEYITLEDFTIDEQNKRVILYVAGPYKIIYFDFLGKYISEKSYDALYANVSYSNGKLILLQLSGATDYILAADDLKDGKRISSLPVPKHYGLFESLRLASPNIIRSKNTYLSLLYMDTVFKIKDGRAFPRYFIDFGDRKMPDYIFDKGLSSLDVYKTAKKNGYGFALSNFSENDKYVYFSYGANIIVVYAKEKKQVFTFSSVMNIQNGLFFNNIIGHDGSDNYMISVLEASRFKRQLMAIDRKSSKWTGLPKSIKALDSSVTMLSNPIIQVYTMKD